MAIPNYITTADLTARLSTDAYNRAFDRNGTGTVDAAFVQQCVDDACSQWQVWTGAALPGDWTLNGASVEVIVKRRLAGLACYFAAENYPGAGTGNPYQAQYDAAKALAADLSRDRDARLVTSAPGRPRPRANTGNTVDSAGNPTNPYGQAADRKDGSGF